MGLFDHLFKNKPPSGEEKVVETSPEASAPARPPETVVRSAPPQRADPSAFLHPKNYVPRGAPGLTPAPRSGISTGTKVPERRPATGGEPPAADEIVLTLGDVLSRIPTHYLKHGSPDSKRELRFRINDLSSDIARGRAAVPLSRIAQLVPDIFVKEIGRDEDTEIRLPLQKLVEQIGLLRSRPKAPAVEKLPRPTTTAEVVPPVRPPISIETREAPPVFPSSAIPVVAERAAVAPVVLGEPAPPSQHTFELKPAADQPAPPVILETPSAVEPPPEEAALVSPEVVSPEPVVAEVAPPVEVEKVVAQPTTHLFAPVSAPPPSAPQEPVKEPAKIAVDWAAAFAPVKPAAEKEEPSPEPLVEPISAAAEPLPAIVEPVPVAVAESVPTTAEPVPEPAVEAIPTAAVVDEPKTAPAEAAELEVGAETIQLSLAAILRHCPLDIVVGELPTVDDSVRVSLPFAPIDRQLVKGHVEISAARFISALPPAYQKHFVAKAGVNVPIPLEEVFQNLPAPTQELAPSVDGPPPVFLAPAPSGEASAPASVEKIAASSTPFAPLHEEPIEASLAEAPSSGAAVDDGLRATDKEVAHAPSFSIVPPPTPVEPSKPERPIIDLPFPAIVEKAPDPRPAGEARPPMPFPSAPSFAERTPVKDIPADEPPVVANKSAEVLSAVTAESSATEAEPQTPAGSAEESPKLVLQPRVVRPFVVPPPPIFGFVPVAGATEPESTPPTAPEPPSLISALNPQPVSEAVASAGSDVTPVAAVVPVPVESVVQVAPEPVLPPPNDFEPSVDLIASAPEDAASATLGPQSAAVGPFADVADTLAHETTYAEAHAAVVHIDEPYTRPPVETRKLEAVESAPAPAAVPAVEAAQPGVVEQPTEPTPVEKPASPEGHHVEPLVEGLAAAGVAVAEVTSIVSEPSASHAVPSETAPEPSPHPLFPVPKHSVEHATVDVLPPPALPLRRFDQDAVQALFMTEEALDLPKISRLAAALPGVYACVIATRDQACTGGTLPEGFDLAALLGLAPRVGEAAGRMPIGALKHFTLYGEAYSVSFFERHGLSLCAVHRPRSFVPGVREKLVALADELSR